MLKAFQKRERLKKVVFTFILVMVVVGMVVYLIPGFTGMTGGATVSGVVAEVQGEEIQAYELQQAMFRFGQQNRVPTEMMEIYSTQILSQIVLERATTREAERLGLRVSEAEVVERLRQIPDLFPEGKFVGREAYEDMVFTRFNTTPAEFERQFRNSILQGKLQSLVTDSVVVSPEEVRKAFQNENEKLVVDYAQVNTEALKAEIKPSDETLQEYYTANQIRYQVPERRAIRFILFDEAAVGQSIEIPEADLQRYYQSNQNNYRVDERVQVSHILLQIDPAKKDEIRRKADDLLARLKGGADFAVLARQYSEDPGSAGKGGDLGYIVRGQTVPEFEAAAFSVAPGSLSDVVETSFGLHILKVAAHEQARLRPLEEVKEEIRKALQLERVRAMLPRRAEEAVAALRRTPNDIEAIASRLGAQAFTVGPVPAGGTFPGVGASAEMDQEVFSLQKDEVSRPIQVQSGYVVLFVTDVAPAHQGEFQEVKTRIQEDYVGEQARARASTRASELAEALSRQEKKDLKRAAQSLRLTVNTSSPLTRSMPIPSVGRLTDLDPTLFTKEVGEVAGPFPTSEGHVVLQIASREAPKEEEFPTKQAAIEQRLLQAKRQQAFAVFEDNLRSRLEAEGDLVIYQDVLNHMSTSNVLPPGEHPPYPHSHPPGF